MADRVCELHKKAHHADHSTTIFNLPGPEVVPKLLPTRSKNLFINGTQVFGLGAVRDRLVWEAWREGMGSVVVGWGAGGGVFGCVQSGIVSGLRWWPQTLEG